MHSVIKPPQVPLMPGMKHQCQQVQQISRNLEMLKEVQCLSLHHPQIRSLRCGLGILETRRLQIHKGVQVVTANAAADRVQVFPPIQIIPASSGLLCGLVIQEAETTSLSFPFLMEVISGVLHLETCWQHHLREQGCTHQEIDIMLDSHLLVSGSTTPVGFC